MKRFEDAVQTHRKIMLEDKARQDADAADLNYPDEGCKFLPSPSGAASYWEQVVNEGENAVYLQAYRKRIARRERLER
jgi:hypothetical protein